jgi:hypothetical protein
MRKETPAPRVQFGLLVAIKTVPDTDRLLDAFWWVRQTPQPTKTIEVVDEFILGHPLAVKHRPPQGFVLTAVELDYVREQLLDPPMFTVGRRHLE